MKRERRLCTDGQIPQHGNSYPFGALGQQVLNPSKLVYDPEWPNGQSWQGLLLCRTWCFLLCSGDHNHHQYIRSSFSLRVFGLSACQSCPNYQIWYDNMLRGAKWFSRVDCPSTHAKGLAGSEKKIIYRCDWSHLKGRDITRESQQYFTWNEPFPTYRHLRFCRFPDTSTELLFSNSWPDTI